LAAVFFGDPDDGESVQNIASTKDVTYCFEDDLICDGLPIVLPAHLSYALDAVPTATMVAGLAQV
jgi:cutinase